MFVLTISSSKCNFDWKRTGFLHSIPSFDSFESFPRMSKDKRLPRGKPRPEPGREWTDVLTRKRYEEFSVFCHDSRFLEQRKTK